jgi:hypothetical protein
MKLSELEKRGFVGIDKSLEISLFEYGLAWTKEVNESEYLFYYGIKRDDFGDYCRFDWGRLSVDTNMEEEFNWADFDKVADFTGTTKEEFLKQDLPRIISDLLAYYGYENVFGSCYCGPFEIEND